MAGFEMPRLMTVRDSFIAAFSVLLSTTVLAHDAANCASSIKDLRNLVGDPAFSSRWAEVSMDDGKPMTVAVTDRNGLLHFQFVKSGEGVWAEISGVICKNGPDLEARLSREQITVGPAAHWVFAVAVANGAAFTVRRRSSNQLKIDLQGWSGYFAPTAMK